MSNVQKPLHITDEVESYKRSLGLVKIELPYLNTLHPAGIYLVRLMQAKQAAHNEHLGAIKVQDKDRDEDLIQELDAERILCVARYTLSTTIINRFYAVLPTADDSQFWTVASNICTSSRRDIESSHKSQEFKDQVLEALGTMHGNILDPTSGHVIFLPASSGEEQAA
jgi:hypothetical protein